MSPSAGEPARKSRLRNAVRSLRHRNFRLFLVGQIISVIGTWMQSVALSWLVYRLTRSPFLLGLVGFASQAPSVVGAPFAGVLADRWNRHRMVIGTQVLGMIQAGLLALLVVFHLETIGAIVALSLFLGFVNAADVPARQSFFVEMVNGREDLANAIALNSSMFNLARLVGPALAGILIGLTGEAAVFALNALSYVAVLAALFMMKLPERPPLPQNPEPVLRHLKEGLVYAWAFLPIRAILLLLATTSLFGVSYTVLLPIFATQVLNGGAHTFGFLVASTGVGALAGAVFIAVRQSVRGLGGVIAAASFLFGVGLVGFSLSRTAWLSFALLCVAGAGLMAQMASSNTILQTLVDDDKRGRVMSLYTVSFMGTLPLGNLLAGSVAARIGSTNTVLIGGALCMAASLVFRWNLPTIREDIRPIYRRLGIIPDVPEGIPPASEPPEDAR